MITDDHRNNIRVREDRKRELRGIWALVGWVAMLIIVMGLATVRQSLPTTSEASSPLLWGMGISGGVGFIAFLYFLFMAGPRLPK